MKWNYYIHDIVRFKSHYITYLCINIHDIPWCVCVCVRACKTSIINLSANGYTSVCERVFDLSFCPRRDQVKTHAPAQLQMCHWQDMESNPRKIARRRIGLHKCRARQWRKEGGGARGKYLLGVYRLYSDFYGSISLQR